MINVFIDDIREPPDKSWIVVRNYEDAISLLIKEEGNINRISFDHDLGIGCYNGYDIASWLEKKVFIEDYNPPKRFYCHSQNPVGKENIRRCLHSIWKFQQENKDKE